MPEHMYLDSVLLRKRNPVTKGHILPDSIYMKFPEQANPQPESKSSLGLGGGENEK